MTDMGEYSSQYFNDGIRRVDYVLAYEDGGDKRVRMKRNTFEENLMHEGLQLELEDRNVNMSSLTSLSCSYTLAILNNTTILFTFYFCRNQQMEKHIFSSYMHHGTY